MRHKWLIWGLKLLWVVGLFGLLLIGYEFQQAIQQKVDSTFKVLPLFWFHGTVPFIFGLYISLLFVKGWSFKFNPSLFLCVTVPCLIVTFYMPVVFTFVSNTPSDSSFGADISFLMLKINSFGIAPIVAGLTFFASLFHVAQPSKN
ncbi:hypothetical protein ACFVSW_17575 [Neobacillus sp. NPDC058068]|uniref:hypothetical protein n=1 Tax=Neobacillus sp. NPDC058068 TaxID=3346325 RepID=UPI0036D9E63F